MMAEILDFNEPVTGTKAISVALGYAARGWPVFPCNPLNKRPLTEHGFKDASTDPFQIRKWWGANPNAMIGVPTGAASGVWVLDIDQGDGKTGVQSLGDGAQPRRADGHRRRDHSVRRLPLPVPLRAQQPDRQQPRLAEALPRCARGGRLHHRRRLRPRRR
jgi:hypothetical protein